MANSEKPKKVRITIELDEDVVGYFKMLAHKDERPYQPLMNRVLRDYVIECVAIDEEAKNPIATSVSIKEV